MTGLFEGRCRRCRKGGLVRGTGLCNPCAGFPPLSKEAERIIKTAARRRFFAARAIRETLTER